MSTQSNAIAKAQQEIASGKRLERPSQGASDFVTLIDYRSRDLRLKTFQDSINDTTTSLNDGVSHLTEAEEILTTAHRLGSEGANAATDDNAYEALATNVDALIERLLTVANSQSGGRYLFAGAASTTQPFEVTARDAAGRPTTIDYRGSDERSKGIIAPGQTVDTIYSGNRVFQSPGADVFQSLIDLRDTLRNPAPDQNTRATTLNARIKEIEVARKSVLSTVGEQASSLENLEALKFRIDDVRVNVQGRMGEIEGTDFAEAAVRFQEQQNAFQATLSVTAKIFEASLVDFVR
jgi:flagellar hook-associated protein 3 FlgL